MFPSGIRSHKCKTLIACFVRYLFRGSGRTLVPHENFYAFHLLEIVQPTLRVLQLLTLNMWLCMHASYEQGDQCHHCFYVKTATRAKRSAAVLTPVRPISKAKTVPAWRIWAPDERLTCVSTQLKWLWGDVCCVPVTVNLRAVGAHQSSNEAPYFHSCGTHAARIWSAPLHWFIHAGDSVSQIFWSAGSKKNVLLLCGKKNKREMICALHKSKFKVKLHSWDTSKNSMSLVQWSLNAWKVMAHITTESCLWQKRDKAEFKILNCELKFLQLVKGSFPYAKKYWAWCKHLFSCSGIAGLWAFHIIYQGTTE